MMDTPLVSLMVISYNHRDYIDDCMKSILGQSYGNIEILYLDDASVDETFQKASYYRKQLESKYERVEFIENPRNDGLVRNLNRLVRMSRGKYVKTIAADDFILSDGIEQMTEFMERYPEHDMMYANGLSGNETTHFPIDHRKDYDLLYQTEQISGADIFERLYRNYSICAASIMIRKSVYEKIGLYDEELGVEDFDLSLRIARQGSIGYLHEPTVMYRMLTTSMSHSADVRSRKNMKKSTLQILEKHKDAVANADELLCTNLNDALRDAFHIDDKEYIRWLYKYADRNDAKISLRNRVKHLAYRLGMIETLK